MAQEATLNQAQLQILDMMSFIKTPEALSDLNRVISDYFVQKADAELDQMWADGTLSEDRIESFRHLHERTPYNKPIL
ncbi:dephospho-CoA kinase [Segatella copri]|uniref:dephospho-CoA kinase n=1 Tax=Segatella copri TaxID=165179 RepID=UPI00129242C8|nr:dephospho-CoA kinase [Segatella copri]MQN16755.1 dephospho-CoA kinase [Segatella copri]MQN17970.1 dephospho-CoA kinase [Segatella copri]